MKISRNLLFTIFVAVLGSVIFGINMAAIAGAVPFIKENFILSDFELGLVVSVLIVGCMIGAFSVGKISDKFGRKNTLIFTSLLFLVSALGSGFATSSVMLMVARLIGGIAVGGVSVVIPTFISEISPAKTRGTLGTMNQLGIVIGILLAYVFDFYMVGNSNGWRWMLASPAFVAIPFTLLLVTSFPESPRWLILKGQNDRAKKILLKMIGSEAADLEYLNIQTNIKEGRKNGGDQTRLSSLFKGKLGKVVFIGIMLAALQQITGINAIVAYAPTIFQQTGVGGDIALLQSILVGVVNFVFTLVAVWLIDKLGRKVLLVSGAAGMVLSLVYLVYAFLSNQLSGLGVTIAILAYIAFFAASLAPVMWVVTSEIYPNKIRGIAMSVSTAVSWVCTFLTVQFFPWMLNHLGGAYTFGVFLFFSLFALLFIIFRIPETKGKSLEEIEVELGLKD